MEIGENQDGSYILNANDLCAAPFIDPGLPGGRRFAQDRGPRQDVLLRRLGHKRLPPRAGPLPGRPGRRRFRACPPMSLTSWTAPATATIRRGSTLAKSRRCRPPATPMCARGISSARSIRGKTAVARCTQRGKFSPGRYARSPAAGRHDLHADAGLDTRCGRRGHPGDPAPDDGVLHPLRDPADALQPAAHAPKKKTEKES